MRCAIEADTRWLRGQLPACMALDTMRREGDGWESINPVAISALLNPIAHQRDGVPFATELRLSDAEFEAVRRELERQRQADEPTALSQWSHRLPNFWSALRSRLAVVEEEGLDAVEVATEELRRAQAALGLATERGNRAQITRAENTLDAAGDTLDMTGVYWAERVRWLRDFEVEVRLARPSEQVTALIKARKLL